MIDLDEWTKHVAGFSMSDKSREQLLANFALGMVCEAGEAGDLLKKYLFHGDQLDEVKLKKELGDVAFYWTALSIVLGFDPIEILEMNREKLVLRHGGTTFNRNVQRQNKKLES